MGDIREHYADSNSGTLTSLNVSNNGLGELAVPDGWEYKKGGMVSASKWVHSDGRKQKKKPEEPLGVIALANSIRMSGGAMTSLNIDNNRIQTGLSHCLSDERAVTTDPATGSGLVLRPE